MLLGFLQAHAPIFVDVFTAHIVGDHFCIRLSLPVTSSPSPRDTWSSGGTEPAHYVSDPWQRFVAACITDIPDNLSSAQALTVVIPVLSISGLLAPSDSLRVSQANIPADEWLYSALVSGSTSCQFRRFSCRCGSLLYSRDFLSCGSFTFSYVTTAGNGPSLDDIVIPTGFLSKLLRNFHVLRKL